MLAGPLAGKGPTAQGRCQLLLGRVAKTGWLLGLSGHSLEDPVRTDIQHGKAGVYPLNILQVYMSKTRAGEGPTQQ